MKTMKMWMKLEMLHFMAQLYRHEPEYAEEEMVVRQADQEREGSQEPLRRKLVRLEK